MSLIKTIWKKWKAFAHVIARFQARIILSIFYFTILAPFGIVVSLFKDELHVKTLLPSTFVKKTKQSNTYEEMKKQF